MQLDPTLVGSVLVEAELSSPRCEGEVQGIDVSPLDASLLDAMVRLIRLLDSPADARVLARRPRAGRRRNQVETVRPSTASMATISMRSDTSRDTDQTSTAR